MKHPISPRQIQIMRQLCAGMVAKEIAEADGVSIHTIKSHIIRIKVRMNARNIVQAVAIFSRREV